MASWLAGSYNGISRSNSRQACRLLSIIVSLYVQPIFFGSWAFWFTFAYRIRNQRISGITLITSISLIAVTWLLACVHIPAFSVNERKGARDGRGAVVPSSQLRRTFILQGELTGSYDGISRSNSRQACRLLSIIVSLYVQPIFFGSWAFWFTFAYTIRNQRISGITLITSISLIAVTWLLACLHIPAFSVNERKGARDGRGAVVPSSQLGRTFILQGELTGSYNGISRSNSRQACRLLSIIVSLYVQPIFFGSWAFWFTFAYTIRNQRISGITLITSISLIAVTWLLACLHIPAFSVNERKGARDGRGAVVPSSQLGRTFILQGELTGSYNGISRSNSRQACRLLSIIVSLYVQPIFFGSWAFWFTFAYTIRNQRISGITLITSISLIAVTWLLACLHIPAFSVNERKGARDGRGAVVPSSQLGRTFILQGELTGSYNGISRSNSRLACHLLSIIVSLYVQPIFFGSWALWFTFPHIP